VVCFQSTRTLAIYLKILLIENDAQAVALTICAPLRGEREETASDGDPALDRALQRRSALVIWNVMRPKRIGLHVCHDLRIDNVES
jgi:DNA-binding response OmpR family regulator